MADNTEPKNTLIVALLVISMLLLFFTTFGLMFLYDVYFRKYQEEQVANVEPSMVSVLRAEEQERLTKYARLTDGTIRIPITRAMELEAKEPWRPQAPWPTPTPTPQPTPTPSEGAQDNAEEPST